MIPDRKAHSWLWARAPRIAGKVAEKDPDQKVPCSLARSNIRIVRPVGLPDDSRSEGPQLALGPCSSHRGEGSREGSRPESPLLTSAIQYSDSTASGSAR